MQYSYPLLRKVFDHYSGLRTDCSQFKLYSCMHLLAPQLEMYKLFLEFGLLPQNITVLGKIYSSNEEVVNELRALGINVIQPPFSRESFDKEHGKNCREIAEQISGVENIILDDGAYIIEAGKDKDVLFAVEQTSAGYRRLEKEIINFPIFNVARSSIKLEKESPYIAQDACERIDSEVGLSGKKVAVIGQGPIGKEVLRVLREKNIDAIGFDKEMTGEKLLEYLVNEKPDIVIGATGRNILSSSDLQKLESKHIYYFVSVSSSDREFPVENLRTGIGIHNQVSYKNFRVLNNGFPISFKGRKNELPPEQIEKTIALLLGSVLHGLTKGSNQKGWVNVPNELQNLILA